MKPLPISQPDALPLSNSYSLRVEETQECQTVLLPVDTWVFT